VTVWVPDYKRAVGRYFAGLLDELGLRASLRVVPGGRYFDVIYAPRTRASIGFVGWSSDYMSASNFIGVHFRCGARENASHFCDRGVTRQVGAGLAARGTNAAERWAAADRRIVDQAPAVPMTNHRAVVFVSRRVGNVQQHLQWFTLLDQLWVR
jgi:peptide/nickel transport system substrate-binding protein